MAARGPMTHYQRLGVASSASTEEIRAAYRARARLLHPDRRGQLAGNAGEAEMAAVNEAWRVLREPHLRQRYDVSLRATPPGGASAPPPWRPDPEDRFAGPVPEPEFGERAVRTLPWVVLVVVLAAIFVVTAFARQQPMDDTGPTIVDDGIVTIGSCVAVVGGRTVAEVACEGEHRVTVVSITSGAVPCAVGLESYGLPSGERVCVRRT